MLAVATNQLEKDDGANGEEEESNSSGDEMPEVTPRTGFGMTFENKKERKNRKIMEAAAAGAEGVEDDFDAGSEEEEDDEDEDEDMSEGEGSGSDEEGYVNMRICRGNVVCFEDYSSVLLLLVH